MAAKMVMERNYRWAGDGARWWNLAVRWWWWTRRRRCWSTLAMRLARCD